jgi:sugar phosphate isomerase/epimerase
LKHTRQWVDRYAKLGAPAIRIFAGQVVPGETLSTTLRRCAENCKKACAHAANQGVWLALENHGGVTAKAEGLLEIVRQVDSPFFGVNFDSGNFRDSSDPYAELAQIAPYAVNAQIKVEIQVNGQNQESDLPRVVDILRDAGYSGWVALEYEASEEPIEAIPRWLDRLKPLMDA